MSLHSRNNLWYALLVLSLVFFFLEEFFVFFYVSNSLRFGLAFLGFIFDLTIFFVFLGRLFHMIRYRLFGFYIRERFFIEVLHSLLPLLFYSLPLLGLYLKSFHMMPQLTENLSSLPLLIPIKFLRILRFQDLLLSLLPHITQQNRSLVIIESYFVLSFVVAFLLYLLSSQLEPENPINQEWQALHYLWENESSQEPSFWKNWPPLLELRDNHGKILYQRDKLWKHYYVPHELQELSNAHYTYVLDQKVLFYSYAKGSLLLFSFSIAFFFALLQLSFFFSKNFLSPLRVMLKNFQDPLEYRNVIIPPSLQEETLFKLAKEMNNQFIPKKLNSRLKSKIPFDAKALAENFPKAVDHNSHA